MVFISILVGIIFGFLLSLSLVLLIVTKLLKESNDIGDSMGTLSDFGTYVHVTASEDGLSRMM